MKNEKFQNELTCPYLHDCPKSECVSNKFKCDRKWDWQKGEDEKFCSQIILGGEDSTSAERRMIDTEDDYTPAPSVFIGIF